MRSGYAREKITPPVGTRMLGFWDRDRQKGCEGVHDDLYVNALYLEHGGEIAVIVGYDLCFFSRAQADRLRGVIGRKLNLCPRQILLNSSHTHVGPCTADWCWLGPASTDPLYMDDVEAATVKAVEAARATAREAGVWSGLTRTQLPLSRRRPNGKGGVDFRPFAEGAICGALPLCLFKDKSGRPICLLFSVSCHPSTIGGWQISADYPGVAARLINRHLGLKRGGAMFLQGCGGDTKASVIGNGKDATGPTWRAATWNDVAKAGRQVADEAITALTAGLKRCKPDLRCRETEMEWPLAKRPTRTALRAAGASAATSALRKLWADRMLEMISRRGALASRVSILLQGIKIADHVRLIGLEGEAVAGLGLALIDCYKHGVTFPLGYIHGTRLYLPTEHMLSEKGYEVDSYYEYGFPAPLAPGFEKRLLRAMEAMKMDGID